MRFTPLFVAALIPYGLLAQVRDTAPVLLPSVSVTATRAPLVTRALPVAVSVFDRAAIRDAGITHLVDIVRLLPGATVLSNGSFGSQAALFYRGGESDYVQVLVDGVPLNAPGGFYNFGTLTLDNVDRVEVVRGAGSLLYGSDAVSGVIQIFTRTGVGRTRANAVAGGGSLGSERYELGALGSAGGVAWSLSGARHITDGIFAFNSGYRHDVASGAARWTGERAHAGLSARATRLSFSYPTNSAGEAVDSNARNLDEQTLISSDGGYRVADWLEVRGRAAYNRSKPRTRDEKDNATDADSYIASSTVTRSVYEARAIATVAPGHMLTLSVERARDEEESTSGSESSFGPFESSLTAERANTAAVAQMLGNLGSRATYTAGVRRDDNGAFGTFTTGRVGAAVRLSPQATVRASFGNAFKAPTFFENFATGFTVGNPDLTPERAKTFELGGEWSSPRRRVTVGATVFAQRFTDLIQYFGAVPPGEPNFVNLAAASADGIELEGIARLAPGITARVSYTYLRTEVTDAGADEGPNATFVEGERLLRRPKHFATLTVRQTMESAGTFDALLTYIGDRDDRDFTQFPSVPIVMKGFTRLDFSTVSPFGDRESRTALISRVENVLDKRYQQTFGFAAPRRTFFLGVRIGD